MLVNRIYIASPSTADPEETQRIFERASRQVAKFHYEPVGFTEQEQKVLSAYLGVLDPDTEVNQNLLFASSVLLRMSTCRAVFMSKNWQNDMTLMMVDILASYYGLEVIYEEDPEDENVGE